MILRFVSSNEFKIKEVQQILDTTELKVFPFESKIEELQTEDVHKLVKDKLLKAFKLVRTPVFVEHTGLYINELDGFPAGLTQIFWDRLKAEKFAHIIGNFEDPSLEAITTIGFCDGKIIEYFEGKVKGTVPKIPSGNRDFQWDCVFIPEGYEETFADMGEKKNEISMRKLALEKFRKYLRSKNE